MPDPRPPLSAEALAALASPRAYPQDPSAGGGVRWVQTHISHVFLTGERVYKFRKSVDLGFVRFTALDERNADCLREVALNRRLAPDVYLGVAPLEEEGGGVRVGPLAEGLAGPAREHCVVMRRLPEGRDALTLLEAGALGAAQIDRAACRIAAFHGRTRLGTPSPFGVEDWIRRCTRPVEDNFRLLAESPEHLVPPADVARALERARAFARDCVDRFEARREEGRAVDGHGDLHLQHVWFESDDAEPLVIDCLEFNERLRRIDAASDVAFTAMDLRYRRRPELAERFLRVYARESDDFGLFEVVDYFVSYRAAVRAKVAAISAVSPEIGAEQRAGAAASTGRHLALALRALEPRPAGVLVAVGGVVGTGKSTAAELLADAMGAVVIATDRVRKHRFGLAPAQRPDPERAARIYAMEEKRRVYEAVADRARRVLRSGRGVVLDGTFSRRADRERVQRLARDLGARMLFIETRCAPDIVLARLARRAAADADASDAGPERYRASVAAFEKLDEWPADRCAVLHTDREGWREALRAIAADLRS
jgi:aminoglycoside phosphotransferase family enzyme/predicted kinase